MKRGLFFLWFLLLPAFLCARSEGECFEIRHKATKEWNKSTQLIEKLQKLDSSKTANYLRVLKQAIAHCEKARKYSSRVVRSITRMDRRQYIGDQLFELKRICRNDRDTCKARLKQLQQFKSKIQSFKQAKSLYEKGVKNVDKAKTYKHPSRTIHNVEDVVRALKEVAKLYEEAALLLDKARKLISFPGQEKVGQEKDRETMKKFALDAKKAAHVCRKEAEEWKTTVRSQVQSLATKADALRKEHKLFTKHGMKQSAYETQKQLVPILELLRKVSHADKKQALLDELARTKTSIEAFIAEKDMRRLTEPSFSITPEAFKAQEEERTRRFFANVHTPTQPFLSYGVIALDGQRAFTRNQFTLYSEQFYRFLVEKKDDVSEVFVKVYDQEACVHEEKILLPVSQFSWDRYLLQEGMTFIPETKLQSEFGLDLRIRFVSDPLYGNALVIAQKAKSSRYRFAFSFHEESLLYECRYLEPPPWQLTALRKPGIFDAAKPILPQVQKKITLQVDDERALLEEKKSYPLLDQLVSELKSDPLAIAAYVHNEISLVTFSFLFEANAIRAPPILRNPSRTFLEKRGSPWEQCQLLAYLLRKAGYKTLYITEGLSILEKRFFEKLFFTRISGIGREVLLNYPGVLFFNGSEWIPLFPWMKEIEVEEGYDLYSLMPEEYASSERWILRYLKGDENILKHIGPDNDDTAGSLFTLFVEEALRKQGLSLSDVGIYRKQLKRQFSSWEDFPRPSLVEQQKVASSIDANLFVKASIEFSSRENPHKKLSHTFSLADINCNTIPIQFLPDGKNKQRLQVRFIGKQKEESLHLDESDRVITIQVTLDSIPEATKKLSINKGTTAALCFHFGGETSQVTSQFYQQFANEKEESKRPQALLSYVGAAYFEKCGRAQESLAKLHKVGPGCYFAFGLAKFSPANPNTPEDNQKLPQVDMIYLDGGAAYSQKIGAFDQFSALSAVDASSNEHQILKEVFSDPYAISTVKLLQLAHTQQQKKGLSKEGFLTLTSSIFEACEKTPEAAQTLYFPHLKDMRLRDVKNASGGQWSFTKNAMTSPYAYAYMTPGATVNQNGTYKEMATLLFHPSYHYALISSNTLVHNGGLGSALSQDYFSPSAIKKWQLAPQGKNRVLTKGSDKKGSDKKDAANGIHIQSPDVRANHKSPWNSVADPVDVVTGSFYIDEVDSYFPFEIRRNYNSQNPVVGEFGCGWKMNLNPYLVKQDDKLFAAEADGTVIAYRYHKKHGRWEVCLEDNPDLCNQNPCPFHAYIENDILYGADGSKRFFEKGLLKKWINAQGDTLTFIYTDSHLTRIESSNGNFCGLHYNHEGKISEIYTKDGRRISYSYNAQGELVRVTLPNTAEISYEYDRFHRIIRETSSHGKVLENIYDDQGRVREQRSPAGQAQSLITTASFEYQDGSTVVRDACGGKTTYKIFQKKIYKIIDPLGNQILQSWFIDTHSWFDAEQEKLLSWDGPGAFPRSLKSSTDKRGLTTCYLYDEKGNAEEITLKGADLTGSGVMSITKRCRYNKQNLLVKEEMEGQITETLYDAAFPYLPKRIEKYRQGTLSSFEEYTYTPFGKIEKEDHSGSITLWSYDSRGFPIEKRELSSTSDPDVVTFYCYNHQGQCISILAGDCLQKIQYDIMGNPIQEQSFSRSGKLLSEVYKGYNLNNQLVWTERSNNRVYLDYNASGLLKASRQSLNPDPFVAYRIYDYDPRGYLSKEVDPLGVATYREYDALGNVTCETKEGHSIKFTYEPGGLVETICSPEGRTTKRLYTTNGLLKKEVYPDGSELSRVYDIFGRVIQETKNGITWDIAYEANRSICTHRETATKEIKQFDARGNLIAFTDSGGFFWKKTYDGLNRLKSETTPTGEATSWSYQGDMVFSQRASGEVTSTRFEGGQIAESKTFDARGDNLIAHSARHFDPHDNLEVVIVGDVITATWFNALGLPKKVQKGNIITLYEYDFCGNCTAIIDGENRRIKKNYDGLGRMVQKELPDGSLFTYTYDRDSNMTRSLLPNGVLWNATYDLMNRKCSEELYANGIKSQCWNYSYENGALKEKIDPQERVHTYSYDLLGRLVQEEVAGWQKRYGYDSRGALTVALLSTPSDDSTLVERSYDEDGRLVRELISCNSKLIQQTEQTWGPAERSLKIGNHKRTFSYQNNQLVKLSSKNVQLSYAYSPGSQLLEKTTPLTHVHIGYNNAGLPKTVVTSLPQETETLEWNATGRLATYHSSKQNKEFTYTPNGYLQSAGDEQYEFDFGKQGIGSRTHAPNHHIAEHGLDLFGKVTNETINEHLFETVYNQMGEVVSCNQKRFEWDPWGRLLEVADDTSSWKASYDVFGRRLQTHYHTGFFGQAVSTTSFYDPEEEFQEIGVQYGSKVFWKLYGPNACDAVLDDAGAYAVLTHTALGQLEAVVTDNHTYYPELLLTAWGPQGMPTLPSDLVSYAKSLVWHSQHQDPTGLIWMGARYYDPMRGRFLSPDPVGHPLLANLYTFANGDPINYRDPDGRFASRVYDAVGPLTIEKINKGIEQAVDAGILPYSSRVYSVGSVKLSRGAIGHANGIANSFDEAKTRATQISNMAYGTKIDCIYNASHTLYHTLAVDIAECGLGHIGIHSTPVKMYKQKWDRLMATKGPDAKFLEICHSGAADHLKNALKTSPRSVQERIIVLAIAPSVVIPKHLCYQSYNYVSKRDLVTYFDPYGAILYRDDYQVLDPHPDAPLWDHDFLSPTFDKVKKEIIDDYLSKYGD